MRNYNQNTTVTRQDYSVNEGTYIDEPIKGYNQRECHCSISEKLENGRSINNNENIIPDNFSILMT